MNIINPLNGQSNYDLCLQSVGSMDGFIKLLAENKIQLSSVPPKDSIYFNHNDILSRVISGNIFSTYSISSVLQPILNNDGTPILNNDGQPIYNNN